MPFLAFEGLDGSGKSTLINGLKAEFSRRQIPVVVTREPGGTELGDEIRQMLLRSKGDVPVPRAEALLYQAGRAQHVEAVIRPALAQKKWVLTDRFAASSVAFQAGGREISRMQIDWLNAFSTHDLLPDLYIFLDITLEESAKRLSRRHQVADRIELETRDFHAKVRDTYLQLAKEAPEGWLVLDASWSREKLLAETLQVLGNRQWLA